MEMQTGKQPRKSIIPFGWIALAVGMGYLGNRMLRKRQSMRWRERLQRIPTRTALVTGASSGIGRTYALRLAEMGYSLVLVARRVERLEALAAECQSLNRVHAEALPADLSTAEGITRVEQRIRSGGIDFLVNNAGYDVFGDFSLIPTEKILGLINCLQLATVRLTQAALPGMLWRRHGNIVNVSSIGAFTPKRKDSIYVSSKAFVNRFTESLGLELKGSGVRVQALCPGLTLTEFHDAPEYQAYHIKQRIPRWLWMKPEQVVEASLQALGENRVICIPGFKNQITVLVAKSGLGTFLYKFLARFIRPDLAAQTLPETDLDLLACPDCHSKLALRGDRKDGVLTCAACGKSYPILDSIPRFAGYENLNGGKDL